MPHVTEHTPKVSTRLVKPYACVSSREKRQQDRQKEGQTEGQTDTQTDCPKPLLSTFWGLYIPNSVLSRSRFFARCQYFHWHGSKITKIRTTTSFFKVDLCSATSMESSRRHLLNGMAEHRSILKIIPNYVSPPLWFRTQIRNSIPHNGSIVFTVRPSDKVCKPLITKCAWQNWQRRFASSNVL